MHKIAYLHMKTHDLKRTIQGTHIVSNAQNIKMDIHLTLSHTHNLMETHSLSCT